MCDCVRKKNLQPGSPCGRRLLQRTSGHVLCNYGSFQSPKADVHQYGPIPGTPAQVLRPVKEPSGEQPYQSMLVSYKIKNREKPITESRHHDTQTCVRERTSDKRKVNLTAHKKRTLRFTSLGPQVITESISKEAYPTGTPKPSVWTGFCICAAAL